jgi:hypothetical protein
VIFSRSTVRLSAAYPANGIGRASIGLSAKSPAKYQAGEEPRSSRRVTAGKRSGSLRAASLARPASVSRQANDASRFVPSRVSTTSNQ